MAQWTRRNSPKVEIAGSIPAVDFLFFSSTVRGDGNLCRLASLLKPGIGSWELYVGLSGVALTGGV